MPIGGKTCERHIFNLIVFELLEEGKLLCPNQSSLQPSDSCVYQLKPAIHSAYEEFDHNPSLEVHANFSDISKVFDAIWYKGLLYKLETVGITGNLLIFFQSFLNGQELTNSK